MGFGVWGLGFGVWGLGFGVWILDAGVASPTRVLETEVLNPERKEIRSVPLEPPPSGPLPSVEGASGQL